MVLVWRLHPLSLPGGSPPVDPLPASRVSVGLCSPGAGRAGLREAGTAKELMSPEHLSMRDRSTPALSPLGGGQP